MDTRDWPILPFDSGIVCRYAQKTDDKPLCKRLQRGFLFHSYQSAHSLCYNGRMIKRNRPSMRMIKAARKAAGLTQAEAGRVVGFSMRSWQDWELGTTPMRRLVYESFVSMTKNVVIDDR